MDVFAEALAIAAALDSECLVAEARTIRNAIDAGSTSTEILMSLRWQIQQGGIAKKTASGETERRIEALVAEINRVLAV